MKFGRLQAFTMALATACAATAVIAQGQSDDLPGLSSFAVMNGTCQRFIVAGEDLSEGCEGKVLNTMYESTGRTGFAFLTRSGTSVTFSGVDTPAQGDQAHSILDRVIFTMDNKETNPKAVKSNVVEATGTCSYTNPYAGPSHINCSATTKNGSFSASFVSDGKAPDIERL